MESVHNADKMSWKRILSLLLCLVIVIGLLPQTGNLLTASAADITNVQPGVLAGGTLPGTNHVTDAASTDRKLLGRFVRISVVKFDCYEDENKSVDKGTVVGTVNIGLDKGPAGTESNTAYILDPSEWTATTKYTTSTAFDYTKAIAGKSDRFSAVKQQYSSTMQTGSLPTSANALSGASGLNGVKRATASAPTFVTASNLISWVNSTFAGTTNTAGNTVAKYDKDFISSFWRDDFDASDKHALWGVFGDGSGGTGTYQHNPNALYYGLLYLCGVGSGLDATSAVASIDNTYWDYDESPTSNAGTYGVKRVHSGYSTDDASEQESYAFIVEPGMLFSIKTTPKSEGWKPDPVKQIKAKTGGMIPSWEGYSDDATRWNIAKQKSLVVKALDYADSYESYKANAVDIRMAATLRDFVGYLYTQEFTSSGQVKSHSAWSVDGDVKYWNNVPSEGAVGSSIKWNVDPNIKCYSNLAAPFISNGFSNYTPLGDSKLAGATATIQNLANGIEIANDVFGRYLYSEETQTDDPYMTSYPAQAAGEHWEIDYTKTILRPSESTNNQFNSSSGGSAGLAKNLFRVGESGSEVTMQQGVGMGVIEPFNGIIVLPQPKRFAIAKNTTGTALDGTEWTFDVTFSGLTAGQYTIKHYTAANKDPAEEKVDVDSSGHVTTTLKMKGGDRIEFTDLPEGLKTVTVKESGTYSGSYWTQAEVTKGTETEVQTVTDSGGSKSVTYTASDSLDSRTLTFNNSSAEIRLTKVIENAEDGGDSFDFYVTLDAGDSGYSASEVQAGSYDYEIHGSSESSGQLTNLTGKSETNKLTLKKDDYAVIKGLPYGAKITFAEDVSEGYPYITYRNKAGESIAVSHSEDGTGTSASTLVGKEQDGGTGSDKVTANIEFNNGQPAAAHLLLDYNLPHLVATLDGTTTGAEIDSQVVDCETHHVGDELTIFAKAGGTDLKIGTEINLIPDGSVKAVFKGIFDAPEGGNLLGESGMKYTLKHEMLTVLYCQWEIKVDETVTPPGGGGGTPAPTPGGNLYNVYWRDNYDGGGFTSAFHGTEQMAVQVSWNGSFSGSPESGSQSGTSSGTVTITIPWSTPEQPYRPGYTFVGWSEQADDTTGEPYPDDPGDSTTFYAIWDPNPIVWDANGGQFDGGAGQFTQDEGVIGPEATIVPRDPASGNALAEPTRVGYTFNGWYFDQECSATCSATSL